MARDYSKIATNIDALPDTAILPDPVAAPLLGISVWTLRRNNPVPPIQVTPHCRGRRLGDIRALVRGQSAQPTNAK